MILVCTGGRNYTDRRTVENTLKALNPTRVFVGDAAGADALVRHWCFETNTRCTAFCADPANMQKIMRDEWGETAGFSVVLSSDWNTQGRAAGPIRNKAMLRAAADYVDTNVPVAVLAFRGGLGTGNCMAAALDMNMIVLQVKE